ncbi:hypothetical protein AJ81_03785 [Pseudothermotoga hypogea DSM 11164 = NBRC 106472]|uniref:Uncharacterized protein n=1 Tax=Pseudothermotoga hypogea DSM 11164 = NBRC 106472 TaxID=1123384 RepID=A0A0X1KTU5_9THEM|nr:hypothetical protein AJ81_03785 [Pseudothermotoga hypogea DSM 11164 = NBRC 106472]
MKKAPLFRCFELITKEALPVKRKASMREKGAA